jgi:UDP-N-acetylmuramoylalanine--D-glutamate ligase
MIPLPFAADKTIAVMGLGRSGRSAAAALSAAHARVRAWDDNESARTAAASAGISIIDPASYDAAELDLVVWSPGIAHTYPKPHPFAERARAAGVKLVCDVELLALACPDAQAVGITGTNGKSTTTALIAHILAASGRTAEAGGNIGIPALDLAALKNGQFYVLELSSYQLELLDRARFDVGVLLNITPDHLGRHGGMTGYVAAKASLFNRLRGESVAIVGIDDEHGAGLYERLTSAGAHTVPISVTRTVKNGVHAKDGILTDERKGNSAAIMDLRTIPTLPGRHNWQNACAAFAAASALGLQTEDITSGIASYPGLAHRQERVAIIDGVLYVNDSKATNADATANALACYESIFLILGGQAKEGGIEDLRPFFPKIAKAFLIGEAADMFASTLTGHVAFEQNGTLDVAVDAARKAALASGKSDAVVLLSPACASWDQFKSFEHRGDVFKTLVQALPGTRSSQRGAR